MSETAQANSTACFFERDPHAPLWRRAAVEGIGTLLLVMAATGGGLASQQFVHQSPALGLVIGALATAGALVGLIMALGAVSGGHFNPLITGLQWLAGERKRECALAYVGAQFGGAILGALLAGLLFKAGSPLANPPATADWSLVVSEIAASAGLMIVVFGCARSGRTETGPIAVGAWLTAAIVATPSTSYANPAIALAALFAAGPIALSGATMLLFALAEVGGALIALAVIAVAYPLPPRREPASDAAAVLSTIAAERAHLFHNDSA